MPWGARSQRCRTRQERGFQGQAPSRGQPLAVGHGELPADAASLRRAELARGAQGTAGGGPGTRMAHTAWGIPGWQLLQSQAGAQDRHSSGALPDTRARQGPHLPPAPPQSRDSLERDTHSSQVHRPPPARPQAQPPSLRRDPSWEEAQLSQRIKICFQVPASRPSRDHPAAQTWICATDG